MIKLYESQAAYLLLCDGCFWLVWTVGLLIFTIIYFGRVFHEQLTFTSAGGDQTDQRKHSSAYNLGQCMIQFPGGADKFTHFSHQHHFVHQGVQYCFVKAVSTFDYWNMDSSLQFWLPTGTKKLKQSATSNSST